MTEHVSIWSFLCFTFARHHDKRTSANYVFQILGKETNLAFCNQLEMAIGIIVASLPAINALANQTIIKFWGSWKSYARSTYSYISRSRPTASNNSASRNGTNEKGGQSSTKSASAQVKKSTVASKSSERTYTGTSTVLDTKDLEASYVEDDGDRYDDEPITTASKRSRNWPLNSQVHRMLSSFTSGMRNVIMFSTVNRSTMGGTERRGSTSSDVSLEALARQPGGQAYPRSPPIMQTVYQQNGSARTSQVHGLGLAPQNPPQPQKEEPRTAQFSGFQFGNLEHGTAFQAETETEGESKATSRHDKFPGSGDSVTVSGDDSGESSRRTGSSLDLPIEGPRAI
jgi:hypothetical protein